MVLQNFSKCHLEYQGQTLVLQKFSVSFGVPGAATGTPKFFKVSFGVPGAH